MRLGFFGGSFDPVHHGHLIAAQDVCERAELDRIVFVPSFCSPLKASDASAPAEQRLALLRAAVRDVPCFSVSTVEIERGGVSYTVETVRELRRIYSEEELFWVIGEDQAAQLPRWRDIGELAKEVGFLCVRRPGAERISGKIDIPGLRLEFVETHLCNISSTDIRRRLCEGRSIRFLTPSRVISEIGERALYQSVSHVES